MPTSREKSQEKARLQAAREGREDWKKWGPYLSERAWGTVREDYSADGCAWDYFPHDQARSRAYRWNEDGILGISDQDQYLCFAIALWNGCDPILKERLFGLTGTEGNHGEDVKEYYYFLDNTPTHSYQKGLYKYPQSPYPYQQLIEENARRGKDQEEWELIDSGIFAEDRYFDVFVEYAKNDPQDIYIRIEVINRGPQAATLHLLPSLWFRNIWSWREGATRPSLTLGKNANRHSVVVEHELLGSYRWEAETLGDSRVLFTENDSNLQRLFGSANESPYVKDGFHGYLVHGNQGVVNPQNTGTKACVHYKVELGAGQSQTFRLRLSKSESTSKAFGATFENFFKKRRQEADEFYSSLTPEGITADGQLVLRQALAGLMWSKQFYHYDVNRWLQGDPAQPTPPAARQKGRNSHWRHANNHEVLLMPDTWEYPWFAAWDTAFHCLALSIADADFAKEQLILLLREWYMHPNGQIPAYEWAFGDVNPPVHAWAALRVFRIERVRRGVADTDFLERVFHKLLLNFTWWVNRKDADGKNLFQGGFLGLDNIGLFDRSAPLPDGWSLHQADGTSWMAMYCLNMLEIALELAREDPTYEDVATKFLEHFFAIAHAMNNHSFMHGEEGLDLWHDEDGFYYDVLSNPEGHFEYLRVRSLVGLIPLLAVATLDSDLLAKLPGFASRLEWFLAHRPNLCADIASVTREGRQSRRLFAAVNEERLRSVLKYALDESEFLSDYGLRSVSRYHEENPVQFQMDGSTYGVDYEPGESTTSLFGGNSNWRGPIWFPINYLLIEALQKFDYYFGEDFRIECPTGSGNEMTLWQVSEFLSQRLIRLFLRNEDGQRPVLGSCEKFQNDPNFRDHLLFYEYFHGDTGKGLGASHQTGWTALVAKLVQQSGVVEDRTVS